MLKHEINLADQHRKIRIWLRNLRNFMESPRFDLLESEHKAAMVAQLEALEELDEALTLRMNLLGLPV